MTNLLVNHAKKVKSLGFHPVPITAGKEKKPPTSFSWTDLRDGRMPALTDEMIESIFSNPDVVRVGIILNNRTVVIDYDGASGEYIFWNEMMPRCSKELQGALRSTAHTKTPHGRHILVMIDSNAFPGGISEIICWQLIGNGFANGNAEIRILSQHKYSIEYGQGYKPIRDIQEIVTLSKRESTELVEICTRFKTESTAIRNISNSLLQYWAKGRRHDLALTIAGYLYKNKVTVGVARCLVHYLAQITNDEELQKRLDAVNGTYDKKVEEVSGYNRLLELVDENESIIHKIEEQLDRLGHRFYDGNGDYHKRKDSAPDSKETDNVVKLSAKVIQMLEPMIELLFKNEFDTAFAAIYVNGHREIVSIHKSKRFNLWVRKAYYDSTGDTIGTEILNEVAETLEAKALFEGPIKPLELRVSKDYNDELRWWYDLCNDNWEVVQIGVEGWLIVKSTESPIMFRRRLGHQAQVYPAKDYDINVLDINVLDQFIGLLNLKDDAGIRLIFKCYLIALLIPGIAKPVLMIHGPKGAAKTTCQDLTKLALDPSKAANLTLPRDTQQLAQQLEHNFLVYYDNVSILREWISNDLCRAVTGTANSKRELYTDDDDIIHQFRRPIGFNGLNLAATRGDLLDRGLIIEVERIDENKRRRLEGDILLEFERIKPQLLGYIFDILVKVLQVKARGGITITSMSRLADFETDCEIIARCLGYKEDEFTKAYRANRDVASSVVIEGSQVAKAIIELMNDKETWSGTATVLLAELEIAAKKLRIDTIKDKSWPKGANVLSRRLTEIKVDLENAGIFISTTENTKTKTKTIVLCKRPPEQPERPDGQKLLSKSADSSGATKSANKASSDESSDKKHQNCAQNQASGDSGDSGDSSPKIKEMAKPTYEYIVPDAYRCNRCKLVYDASTKDTEAHRCNFSEGK